MKIIKGFIVLVIIGAIVGFTVPGQKMVANILEAVSPVSKERQALTDLQHQTDGILVTINKPEFQKLSDTEKLQRLNTLLKETQAKTTTVQNALQQGDLSATASLLIQKIANIDGSNRTTQTTSPTSSNNCPTP